MSDTNYRGRKCSKCKKPITQTGKSGMCKKCSHIGGRYNWKGDKAGYNAKHDWVRDHYGRADHCEINLLHISTIYHWANRSGLYKRIRTDWRQLCPSCHRREHLKEWGKLRSETISQYDISGELIKVYDSLKTASRETKVLGTAICNAIAGRSKTAGGYIWQ